MVATVFLYFQILKVIFFLDHCLRRNPGCNRHFCSYVTWISCLSSSLLIELFEVEFGDTTTVVATSWCSHLTELVVRGVWGMYRPSQMEVCCSSLFIMSCWVIILLIKVWHWLMCHTCYYSTVWECVVDMHRNLPHSPTCTFSWRGCLFCENKIVKRLCHVVIGK